MRLALFLATRSAAARVRMLLMLRWNKSGAPCRTKLGTSGRKRSPYPNSNIGIASWLSFVGAYRILHAVGFLKGPATPPSFRLKHGGHKLLHCLLCLSVGLGIVAN